MAGASCRFPGFLATVALGESIWIAGYGGLGYLFGSEWEVMGQFLSDFGGFALGLALVAGGIAALVRQLRAGKARKAEAFEVTISSISP